MECIFFKAAFLIYSFTFRRCKNVRMHSNLICDSFTKFYNLSACSRQDSYLWLQNFSLRLMLHEIKGITVRQEHYITVPWCCNHTASTTTWILSYWQVWLKQQMVGWTYKWFSNSVLKKKQVLLEPLKEVKLPLVSGFPVVYHSSWFSVGCTVWIWQHCWSFRWT